jgi:hypothetical protein
MTTEIQIEGERFLINGQPTYAGLKWQEKTAEGLLFNSRMVQAIFDDANPATAVHWRYPDTGAWDPERNTNEFCAALPEYRRHGLLGVTVGLQGGGSVYTPEIYEHYENSAFEPVGALRPAYFTRLGRVLEAADACGMVVIVNYFYIKHARRFHDEKAIHRATEGATEWLLRSGRRNLLVDVVNEAADWWRNPPFQPANVHRLIEIVQQTRLDGRRLLVGASSGGGDEIPNGRWMEIEDFHIPHGNGLRPEELRRKLHQFKEQPAFLRQPKPVLVNEDSVFVENLEAAVAEYASWGFYHQGYGCHYKDLMDWTIQGRESRYEELSGFQTVPVNWSINDPWKRAFFEALRDNLQPDR